MICAELQLRVSPKYIDAPLNRSTDGFETEILDDKAKVPDLKHRFSNSSSLHTHCPIRLIPESKLSLNSGVLIPNFRGGKKR